MAELQRHDDAGTEHESLEPAPSRSRLGSNHHDLELPGCTPEPLMAYLKALGVLRLVSEQKDLGARGWWKNDVFWLRSPGLFNGAKNDKEKRDALVKFFLEEYKPTLIVVPWSGADFFGVDWHAQPQKHKKTPTASRVIESFLATSSDRLRAYREVLSLCKEALEQCGIDTQHTTDAGTLKQRKKNFEKIKWRFIERFRATCPAAVLEWVDAAAVTGRELFAPLLGSGGGSDGNTHFSDNFMQNLWDVLPDFDTQRDSKALRDGAACAAGLRDSLFGEPSTFRIKKRTSSLFASGAVGGPNATQGMERESLSNPWDVILGLEGTLCFGAAAVKRLGGDASVAAAFPFQFSASPTRGDGLSDKEGSGREVWLPMWQRASTLGEICYLLSEGRAEARTRPARSGVDMARSIASLGVDRGIDAFHRYAIVKGRVGGDNYNTAASLGRFPVMERPHVDLLGQIDAWLDRFRTAAGDENAPPRFGSALRRIDSAIFDFCKYGGAAFFQRIIVALGAAERELACADRFRKDKKLKPLAGLSAEWINAAKDNSTEFTIALALAAVQDPEQKMGPLRANLEPVTVRYDKHEGKQNADWAEKERCVVWNAADLATNLANVLQRRMMDGERAGCQRLPLASRFTVPLDVIAAFIAGELDDARIEELIWGLMLIDTWRRDLAPAGMNQSRDGQRADPNPLPREYALLKLLFLPRPLVAERPGDKVRWRLARLRTDPVNPRRRHLESGIVIRPEPRILPLLRAGRIGEACRIAAQRLRVSGLPPMPGPLPTGVMRDGAWAERIIEPRRAQRLAAALLIPIASESVNRLVHLVCRADGSDAAEALAASAAGESQ